MKKVAMVSLVAVGSGAVVFPLAGAMHREETIQANVFVNEVAVGGLSPQAASLKLRQWWEGARKTKLNVKAEGKSLALPALSPTMLGVGLDDVETVRQLPLAGLLPGGEPERTDFKPLFKKTGEPDKSLALALTKGSVKRPARAVWQKGTVVRKEEGGSLTLDASTVADRTIATLENGQNTVQVALIPAKKHVSDEDLKQITHVLSSFTTKFSAGNRPRSANIKLAASFFNGQVLMPGDRISYNETVGQRTIRRGFKVAGVYIDGRHDTGVGGGICQVSTTLYNAALFADLKIVQRRNHSLPVPYVPLGRDATVDWGNIDLVFENSSETPIAVESVYTPGKLTFRVLGPAPEPGKVVKIEGTGVRFSPGRVVTKRSAALPLGTTRVEESGGSAKSVSTFRVVMKDGKQIRKDSLGRSFYGGSPRVVVIGTAKPKPKVIVPPATTVPPTAVTPAPREDGPAQTAPLPE
ncbi:hypothetical protein EON79_01550 [bacterium]|nr:MAG: hypothetical protein EON79_01550 [bacterium]